MPPSCPVILLKAPSNPSDHSDDPFTLELSQKGYQPFIVPVIETGLVNLDQLTDTIASGPEKAGIRGVIVTSSRAGEAWKKACETVSLESIPQGTTSPPLGDWRGTPFYVVGPRTATSLRSKTSNSLDSRFLPSETNIIGGDQSGSGEKLAHLIIERLRGTGSATDLSKPQIPSYLLYLTGDKNTGTIPALLAEAKVDLQPLQVYATQPRPSADIVQDLKQGLANSSARSLEGESQSGHIWVVFFAPSAADSALPALLSVLDLPSTLPRSLTASSDTKDLSHLLKPQHPSSYLPQARIAAIGPTTAAHLSEKRPERFNVDVVSPSPNAQSLTSAIVEFDAVTKCGA